VFVLEKWCVMRKLGKEGRRVIPHVGIVLD
jgi:hypothetical protein